MARNAIVSIVVGEKYRVNFESVFHSSWKVYAERHDCDIILFTDTLDKSARAQSRSIAWQKLLICQQPEIMKYDHIAWVDADIIINPYAPSIFLDAPPPGKIATVEYPRHNYSIQKYALCGFPDPPTSGTNTGVFVIRPQDGDILKTIYNEFEEDGLGDYENTGMSYYIYKNRLEYHLDTRFNQNFPLELYLRYPFLRDPALRADEDLCTFAVNRIFRDGYFTHFIGIPNSREFITFLGKASRFDSVRFM